MLRFVAYLLAFGIACSLATWLLYSHYAGLGQFPEPGIVKSPVDFDFAGYLFGVVAVAVTFAGVYLSLAPDKCNEQLMKLVDSHFIPELYSNKLDLEKASSPQNAHTHITRTVGVKCVHAIVVLTKWVVLSTEEKKRLLGTDGIGANSGWLGRIFNVLQNQTDRLIVTCLGLCISCMYLAFPIPYYFFQSTRCAEAFSCTMYFLCILELIVCVLAYSIRYLFFYSFETSIGPWKDEFQNFILLAAAAQVPSNLVAVVQSAQAQSSLNLKP